MTDGLVIQRVPVADIRAMDRVRPVDPAAIEALKADIVARGLRTPIEVSPAGDGDGDGWVLVAGLHRLTVARELGWDHIDAVVFAATSEMRRENELLENLARVELTVLERCQSLATLKAIFESRTGAGRGGDRFGPLPEQNANLAHWYRAVATRSSVSPRTVQRQALIGAALDAQAADRLRGTGIDDTQRELEALSRQAPARQRQIAGMLTADDEGRPTTVAEALDRIEGRAQRAAPTPDGRMRDIWSRAGTAQRRAFIADLDEGELADAVAARGYRLVRV